jgi:hypothetical protein
MSILNRSPFSSKKEPPGITPWGQVEIRELLFYLLVGQLLEIIFTFVTVNVGCAPAPPAAPAPPDADPAPLLGLEPLLGLDAPAAAPPASLPLIRT